VHADEEQPKANPEMSGVFFHRSTHRSSGTKTPTTAASAGSCPRRLEMVRMHLRHDAKITLIMIGVFAVLLIGYAFWNLLFG
jgi:hypothetical protein